MTRTVPARKFCWTATQLWLWFAVALIAVNSEAVTSPATTVAISQPVTRPVRGSRSDAPPPPSAPFPLANAATQAESAFVTLRGIETILQSDRITSRIENDLPILTTEIDSRLDESARLLTSSPSLQVLGEQEDDLTAIQNELTSWRHSLDTRLNQFQRANVEIGDLSKDWDREQNLVGFGKAQGWNSDVLNTAQALIDQTKSLLAQTDGDYHTNLVSTLTLQQQVDGQLARVLEVLDSVHSARDEALNRLLERNSPPIWQLLIPTKGETGTVEQGENSFVRQIQAVEAYITRRRDNVGLQIALLVGLVVTLYWVRNQTRQWAVEQPQLLQATRVFGSPIATAIVLSLLVSGWVYPQAPRLLWAGIGAAALIPTVIILRRLIDRRWFSLLDALVAFYFLDQVRSITAIIPVVARMLLLIEMFGGFLLLFAFVRSSKKAPANTPLAKAIQLVQWLLLAVFFLAFAGNIFGFVSLANLVGDAALKSLYLAVILYACNLILGGFFVIALHSRPLCLLTMVRKNQPLVMRRLWNLLTWVAVLSWVAGVLASVSLATAAFEWLSKILSAHLGYDTFNVSLLNVLEFIFAIWLSFKVSRFLQFILEEDVYDRFDLPGGISYAISKMINYVILLIGFLFALTRLGYSPSSLTVLGSAFAVGLGFGMQNIVNNFVSGLILLFERPVKVGDVIQIADATGIVDHIGIRASVIRTNTSAEIIVPNGNLISSNVTNWTLSNRQRGLEIVVSTGATTDPKHVMELLISVAAAHPLIIKAPKPQAFLTNFGGDSFSYLLRAWTNNADQWVEIKSDLSVAIHSALVRENIPIK